MNFYEQQSRANTQTWRLVLLFIAALFGLIILSAIVIGAGLSLINQQAINWQAILNWGYLFRIALGVVLVVLLASVVRMSQLKQGGKVIAEQLGGRLINHNAKGLSEKRLLNVVEEMAIASGIPVPSIYIIDEPGINAFAAGYQPSDAVVGVTQGALEQLSREELQGVIAHEFSHIFNGDMRLNIRLMGTIYGIMVIALCGRLLLSSSRGRRHGRSNKNGGAIIGIGLALLALGYLGIFFSNLIKAAISRQREYAADAGAVQFTRSNEGISQALKKIGGHSAIEPWDKHDANEISHMLFAQGIQFKFLNGLMATHPPLTKRIKMIDPQWNGSFTANYSVGGTPSKSSNPSSYSSMSAVTHSGLISAINHSGEVSDKDITRAQVQLAAIKDDFKELCQALHDPYTARAWIFVLLLAKEQHFNHLQWQDLKAHQEASFIKQTLWLEQQLNKMAPAQYLTLLDITLPILKMLSENQYSEFRDQMLRLIKVDQIVELREWALFNLVTYYCKPSKLNKPHRTSLGKRKAEFSLLLSAVAHIGAASEQEAQKAFLESEKIVDVDLAFNNAASLSIESLTKALKTARYLWPLEKPVFLKACVSAIKYDDKLTGDELAIIYCIAQALDCPLPIISLDS